MRAMWSLLMPTALRTAVTAVAIAVGSIGQDVFQALPWALLVLILDLVAGSLLAVRSGRFQAGIDLALVATALGAGIAGAAIATSQASMLSVLLVIPAVRAGELRGRLAAAAVVGLAIVVAFGGAASQGTLTPT